jgi:hypothetical protein
VILGALKRNEARPMIGRKDSPPEIVQKKTRPKGFDDFDLRLGDVMRGERATMGKSLLDVQRDLKIKATYIAAIENADPAAFETQGFIAGYVRSYARYLGLDPEWAYSRFCAEGEFVTTHGMSPAASAGRKPAARRAARKRDPLADPDAIFVRRSAALWSKLEPGAIGSSLVLLMLISFIGYGGWALFREVQKVQFAPVDQAPGVSSSVAGLNNSGAVLGALSENAGYDTPYADSLDRLYRPQALEIPVLVARDGPIATLDPSKVGTLVAAMPTPSAVRHEPPAPEPLAEQIVVQVIAPDEPEVVLFAVRPSWVRVQSVDGTVLFEKILDAGERYVLPKSQEPPLLRAGNAGSVYFSVNGVNYGPAGNGPSVVKNVTLSPQGLMAAYEIADLAKDGDLARFVAVAQAQGADASQ